MSDIEKLKDAVRGAETGLANARDADNDAKWNLAMAEWEAAMAEWDKTAAGAASRVDELAKTIRASATEMSSEGLEAIRDAALAIEKIVSTMVQTHYVRGMVVIAAQELARAEQVRHQCELMTVGTVFAGIYALALEIIGLPAESKTPEKPTKPTRDCEIPF